MGEPREKKEARMPERDSSHDEDRSTRSLSSHFEPPALPLSPLPCLVAQDNAQLHFFSIDKETGNRTEVQGISIVETKNGKIQTWKEYFKQ